MLFSKPFFKFEDLILLATSNQVRWIHLKMQKLIKTSKYKNLNIINLINKSLEQNVYIKDNIKKFK